MEIIRAFEALKKLELKVQDLYTYYHKLFNGDREAAGLFFELSLEEKSHADLIDYQLRIIKKNKLLFSDIEFDLEALNQFIAKIDSRVSSKEPVSLEKALEFGIQLEDNALECHYNTLMTKSNPEIGELIRKLGTADSEHADKLRTLARSRGYRYSREVASS